MAFGLTVALRTFIIVSKKLKLVSITWSYLLFNFHLLYQNDSQLNETLVINGFYYTLLFVCVLYIVLKWETLLDIFIEKLLYASCNDILQVMSCKMVILDQKFGTLFYNAKVGDMLKIETEHLSKKLVGRKTLSFNNLELLDNKVKFKA